MSANHDGILAGSSKPETKSRSQSTSLAEQSGKVAEDVQELGRIALANAGEVATGLRDRAGRVIESGAQRARDAKSDFDELVSANPMKSVLIALGVGAVLGFALSRRK